MFRKNLQEIGASETLRWLGFLVLLGHIMTFLFVMPEGILFLSNTLNPQCWSYFPGCELLHMPSKLFWLFYFCFYLCVSLLGLISFYRGQIRRAFICLISATALKTLFLIIDRSFMGNYHFMHVLYCLVYIFFPQKELSLKILLAWFYLAAGSLKLNIEWLSGAAVGGGPQFLPPILQMWSYAYVVVLELIVVWGLFSVKPWIRWLSFAQFFIFHLVSFYWVGYFYPSIVLSMLMVFPFSWINPLPEKAIPRQAIVLVAILGLFQVTAFFSEKDPAIFSHRRLASMNMFDARSVCAIGFQLHQDEKLMIFNPDLRPLGVRVRCDANIVLNQAKNMCLESARIKNFKALDIAMLSKRFTDDGFAEVYKISDVCPLIEKATYAQWLWGEI